MDCPVTITDKAVEKLKGFMSASPEDKYVLMGIRGGGCSGFSYVIDLAKSKKDRDFLFKVGDLSVIVDPISLGYLKGTIIDWVDGKMSSGFSFKNPNAKATCGCGSSFSA